MCLLIHTSGKYTIFLVKLISKCYFCSPNNSFVTFGMRIDILTVVPELLESPLSHSIVGRAIKKGLVEIHVHNLRKYGKGPRQQVDDYSYGGDAGMVLMLEPVYNMISELKAERDYDEVIYMSPDGEVLSQNISNGLSLKENLIILCGHYKGIGASCDYGDISRRLRAERRGASGSNIGGLYNKAHSWRADRRDIGPERLFSGRSAVRADIYKASRIQWLEGSGRASQRQS